MERAETLNRQLVEICAVQATFSEPGEFVLNLEEQLYLSEAEQANVPSEEHSISRRWWDGQAQLSGHVVLPDVSRGSASLSLRFSLPRDYPNVEPILQVYQKIDAKQTRSTQRVYLHLKDAWVCAYLYYVVRTWDGLVQLLRPRYA